MKKKYFMPLLPIILVASFPSLFLYFNNSNEMAFLDIIKPLLLFVICPVVLYIVLLLFDRENIGVDALALLTLVLILYNYTLIEVLVNKVFPMLEYWHVLPIVIFIWIHIACFFRKKIEKDFVFDIFKVISIIFSALILINLVTSISKIINKYNSQITKETEPIKTDENIYLEDMPNVYYLIFDEFSGFNQMKKYYDYENKELEEFLTANNFNISYNSYNESIHTATVIANIFNLDYLAKDTDTQADRKALRNINAPLFSSFKQKGYDLKFMVDEHFYTNMESEVESTFSSAVTISGETPQDILINQTVFYPIILLSKTVDLSNELKEQLNYLKLVENIPEKPTFTFLHTVFPHYPFIVDENGKKIISENSGWEDKQYYLGQYKFASKEMMKILTNLITNDPDAIIIVQSDHGARGMYLLTDNPIFEFEDITNIFNAVYYSGEKYDDFIDQSGVNTMRGLINKMFNENLEYMEVPVNE